MISDFIMLSYICIVCSVSNDCMDCCACSISVRNVRMQRSNCLLCRYTLPFDRHDWIVDSNGVEVRYVIDFYTGTPTVSSATGTTSPVSMHLDVRPALDTPAALLYRMRYGVTEWFNSLNLRKFLKDVERGDASNGTSDRPNTSSPAMTQGSVESKRTK